MAERIHKLTIPSSTRYLEDVRHFVERHAEKAKLPEDSVQQLKMAVDEACANVIEHAYKGNNEQPIDIAVIVRSDRFTVRIRDKGEGFDPTVYQEPDLTSIARSRRAGGLGVHIMHRLMDQVEYRQRGRTNECRLTKYRR
ncbi:MAG: serine/threonine-protein kinase RsbW [Rhodothermales bacterium]|jgi:serine/threonine-protein kinase RsbW